MIKKIWNDAVGSKVIAWAIEICLAALFAPALYWAWKNFGGWPAILLTGGAVAVIGFVFILLWGVRNRSTPRIERVGDVDVTFDEGAVFRLKCWVRLRNDAAECADVQIINYTHPRMSGSLQPAAFGSAKRSIRDANSRPRSGRSSKIALAT
jgi:hypothetical protein